MLLHPRRRYGFQRGNSSCTIMRINQHKFTRVSKQLFFKTIVKILHSIVPLIIHLEAKRNYRIVYSIIA